jgi:hypothetical protein
VKASTLQPLVLRFAAAAVVMTCVIAAAPRADGRAPAAPPVPARPSTGTASVSSIHGAAWHLDNTPIPGARLNLRNLTSGKVESTTVADATGQFTFPRIEGGSYLVELVGENGKILTVGHAFVIAPGETIATFVRLGIKVPWYSGFFSSAASAVASTAAAQGITALAPVQLSKSR